MKDFFRNFLYFSRSEKRGVLLLCFLIIAVICLTPVYHRYKEQQLATETRNNDTLVQAYREFQSRKSEKRPDRKKSAPYTPRPVVLTPFPFDPNTADSALLTQLGLPWWMARNIVRYREKGGKFRRPEDFQRIYGLTEAQFDTLRPYIRIALKEEEKEKRKRKERADTFQRRLWLRKDSLVRPFKYPVGTIIELNSADTTELKKIPGIGSGIARLISGYRHRLGGFYRIEQLGEINLDYEQLRPWFHIDTTAIRRLNLNRAGIVRLRNHPYLNFYQAKIIVEWRKKHGRIPNLKVFRLYEEFTEADFKRLQPYVCYE